jgi:RNA-directed DNA polymerase
LTDELIGWFIQNGILPKDLAFIHDRMNYVQIKNYLVRQKEDERVEIPKPNGKKRPLGIPTIGDRLIQQCIKQVLEPICEAKFHPDSYGFRPNRSAHHAIARVEYLIHHAKLYYLVDVDIKGFFDNVSHAKLLKQLWTIGIQDKNLICIISKMLKAEIKGIGVPDRGTPQGGILSPLLANVVLNELDWWISDQWQTFETNKNYGKNLYRALKTTQLKEVWIVRYADDFKILCRNRKDANKIFIAVKKCLNERLKLEVSSEKSKVVNVKKYYSEFLGFKIKVSLKRNKYVTIAYMNEKAKKKAKAEILKKAEDIVRNPIAVSVNRYNSTILGMHNYYCIASQVSVDFAEIDFLVRRGLYNKLHHITSSSGDRSSTYNKYYAKYNPKPKYIANVSLFPICGVDFKIPVKFTQEICNYTETGRMIIHEKVKSIDVSILRFIMENPVRSQSTEYNDNRISLFVGQSGKCAINGEKLEIGDMEVHHIIPRNNNGTDEYKNLIWINAKIHKLIHAKNEETIAKLVSAVRPDNVIIDKINFYRNLVGNSII